MAKKKRSCEECALSTEKPGFLRSKAVCLAPEGSGADTVEGGRHCPRFVPRMKSLNAVQNLEAMNLWAHKNVRRTEAGEEVTVTETVEATDDDCVRAAQLVGAHDFILRLAQGYQTLLQGDGGNLSQGERQLLAIARAAVANPPVLILDEATSSIDTRTEQLVQRGMDSLMQGRTTFVIAHRLSTVRNADQIIVLDHGRIAEHGTHQELLDLHGQYYSLYTGDGI